MPLRYRQRLPLCAVGLLLFSGMALGWRLTAIASEPAPSVRLSTLTDVTSSLDSVLPTTSYLPDGLERSESPVGMGEG
ncbi:MAG: hypothetical protein AAF821_08125 [Cyanobacteria bacterium P01_D01_bin.156]